MFTITVHMTTAKEMLVCFCHSVTLKTVAILTSNVHQIELEFSVEAAKLTLAECWALPSVKDVQATRY